MPRIKKSETTDDSSLQQPMKNKRASRARVSTTAVKRAPKRVSRRPVPESLSEARPALDDRETPELAPEANLRKAPTTVMKRPGSNKRQSRALIILVILFGVLSGIGVLVGLSDQGSINVVAIINERNEMIAKGEARNADGVTEVRSIPVQNTDDRPNGGLRPSQSVAAPQDPPPAESEVATSTATSTEPVAEDGMEGITATATPEAMATSSLYEPDSVTE